MLLDVTLRDKVSIHAPREGCDLSRSRISLSLLRFQFTHPGRGATVVNVAVCNSCDVSIHAPREGCDVFHFSTLSHPKDVSIHAPREGCDVAS